MQKENKIITTKATEVLKMLWKDGFFKALKDQSSISKYLSELGYNFSAPTLGMALGRAKYLMCKGKRGSYKYIQKYPFAEIIKG